MIEHTPGPWTVFRDPTLYPQGIKGRDGHIVFDVGWGDDAKGPSLQDAPLIAAAPELLDVLRHINDQIKYLQESYGTDGFPEIIARRVREVIAKAEGAIPS